MSSNTSLSHHILLVANRGEIAIRILTAATELGLQTVALYADQQDTTHCTFANHSVKLPSLNSFLNEQHIIQAAKSVQATMIHPGYGFLSESVSFAKACLQENIRFIGPSPVCIESVGDKISARQVAHAARVPVVPGTEQPISQVSQVLSFGEQYGYPLMLKARDGGGGRGIRMVDHPDQIEEALKRCINESPSKQVYIEKAIVGAKHIEVQIIGDGYGNVLHLFDRDCSIQRRYQKVLEVAPCPCLSPSLRTSIHNAAIQIARYIQYDSAGTIEFLVSNHDDDNKKQFYFLEVNPRIQVEHTISEQITNVDIVQTQILVAIGKNLVTDLRLTQASLQPLRNLVSIQARIVAENPMKNNMLSVGKITNVSFPNGSYGVRVDTWIRPGCVVLPTFDSLLAKIIVTGSSLDDALSKMSLALQRTIITGIDTNLDFLTALVNDREYLGQDLRNTHIKSLEERSPVLLQSTLTWMEHRQSATLRPSSVMGSDNLTSATLASSNSGSLQFKPGDSFNVEINDHSSSSSSVTHTFKLDTIQVNNFPDEMVAHVQSTLPTLPNPFAMTLKRKTALGSGLRRKTSTQVPGEVGTPITGMMVEINVQEGDVVSIGQELFVMSAMKMETVIKSPIHGRVQAIFAKAGELVENGDLVVELFEKKESKM
ncbi:carbamoyl-phosphate synthase L chain, ATP binding domain-containing protein [Halteromyces radiatus]|uniref:carbamoyl-phosphate synthase L chain, ATP binding domain-containing protein n=1 Tax=Halteromyces radiatus TaxID=101107 RepID=UPI00222081FB|nr:carbamoyl-phosphate synthase L chain, ATP binding domain-containing protein [Halteromyces radiatus]KAI8082786.1 carbamoyl-phosphate synthase L chain, ATP binding domain-containing protein [Halteromyces radiatus]